MQKPIKTTITYYYYSYYKINQLKQIIPYTVGSDPVCDLKS